MAGARLAPLTQTVTSCLDLSNGWEASGILSPLSDLLAGGVAGAKPEYSVQDQEQNGELATIAVPVCRHPVFPMISAGDAGQSPL